MSKTKFPDGFLWGAATSSHQVEGGNTNDWTNWEAAGHVKNHEQSGQAADTWNRYETDFDLLEELNLNAYRFSLEWSRIEPTPGQFDEAAVQHYRKMLESLKRRGITPIVTLHHFTNPVWLKDWSHRETVGHFESYVEHAVGKLGDLVPYWCTINEPMNVVLLGYAGEIWPPGYAKAIPGYKAMRHFISANNKSYGLIKNIYKAKGWSEPLVGIPLSLPYLRPASRNLLDRAVNGIVKHYRNHYFLGKIAKHTDFIGLNYYHTLHTRWNSVKSFAAIDNKELNLPKNDMGWNIEPEGIYWLAKDIHRRHGLPIIVAENGLADSKDRLRKWYIVSHLRQLKRAIDEGVDVRGYMHWSLIDNFEWADGYGPRFGLAAVDFETQARTVRASAWAYADIAAANAVTDDIKVKAP